MKGVFLDRDSLDRADLDFSRLKATLPAWEMFGATPVAALAHRLADAEVVVTNKVVLDGTLLNSAPRLRLIAVAATGTNNIDVETATELGITVCNVRRYATASVVQHVFALILALTRKFNEYGDALNRGRWSESAQFCLLDFPMRELHGLTLGVIGYGELGEAVTRVAREAFGMTVLVAQRPGGAEAPGRVPLRDLLQRSDVVSLHCPLTPSTRGLLGGDELALMKPDALLINTARGGIIDERALLDALCRGAIGGAGIDVLADEPPPADHPLLTAKIPNLIVTPHIAWASREARQRLIDGVAENIAAFIEGAPQNMVRFD